MASIECGSQSRSDLVRYGPRLEVVINNASSVIPLNKQLPALIDTGAEWNLIEETLATAVLRLKHVENQWIQTANGQALAPVYLARMIIPNLTYSKLQRFIGVGIGADRVLLGREALQDFVLTYFGRSGRVTLDY